MKREILFRGKCGYNNEWVEGFYYQAKLYRSDKELCHYITIPHPERDGQPSDHIMVHPDTVGQFTGLTDKKGKKIFEGDIIEWFAQGESEHPDFGYIEYDEQSFAWRVCWQKYDPDWLEGMQSQYITVIGNVFDNKDLLS
jgi:uncharacterized phage protein (TIGR01671 family)